MKLTFQGRRIYIFDSSRRDKHDGTYIIVVYIKMKKLFVVKDFAQKQLFWLR